jgi:hypothetical protein
VNDLASLTCRRAERLQGGDASGVGAGGKRYLSGMLVRDQPANDCAEHKAPSREE